MKSRGLAIAAIIFYVLTIISLSFSALVTYVAIEEDLTTMEELSYDYIMEDYGDVGLSEEEWNESLVELQEMLVGLQTIIIVMLVITIVALIFTIIAVVGNKSSTNILYLIAGIMSLFTILPAILNIIQFAKKPLEDDEFLDDDFLETQAA